MNELYAQNIELPEYSKFQGIGIKIPTKAVYEFHELLIKIANGSKSQVESFKIAFGENGKSTSFSWATDDLRSSMHGKAKDAAFFLDSLWNALSDSEQSGLSVPPYSTLNTILLDHEIPLNISEQGKLEQKNIDAITYSAQDQVADSEDSILSLQIGEQLGEGGYGVVFRATRSTSVSDFEFALKLLDPSTFVSDKFKALERFKREVQAIQKLNHRAIVHYVEAGITSKGKHYILMPLIRGLDIRTKCEQADAELIVQIFSEMLSGLSYAHENKVLHRDLKPSNILVRVSDSQPIILDFGAAYLLDELSSTSLTTTAAVGTLGYIPSEVLANPKKRSSLHDIYACGVMLYEAVRGHKPDPANYQAVGESRPDLSWLDPIIKDAIAGEMLRMTTAQEFSERLKAKT